MSSQNLIIYKFYPLYHILEELDLDLSFKVIYIDNDNLLNDKIKNLNNYLIISNKKDINITNMIVIDNLPIKIFKLIEKINIEFLKLQFNNQSQVKINNYIIDLNSREIFLNNISREIFLNNIRLKLTEKEINTIIYLSKTIKPVSVNNLQENVWSYQSDIETHTVETHIYRLRKKILSAFDDNEFIISKKNGYQIK